MDSELIAFLDERFRVTGRQIADLHEETTQQITALREETTQQITALREETRRQFDQVDSRLDRVDSRLDRVESSVHHTQITVEALRDEIRLIAEAHLSYEGKLNAFRGEVAAEFEQTRLFITHSYRSLSDRVRALESWREGVERDPIEIIRERYGRKEA